MEEIASIADIIAQCKDLSIGRLIDPVVLICKSCQLKSDNIQDIPVLYRNGYENPLCQICYNKKLPEITVNLAKKHPENYLEYCGIFGKAKEFSFQNYTANFKDLAEIKEFPEKSKLYNLIISGKTGVGKRHLSVSIIRRLLERGVHYSKMYFVDEDSLHNKFVNTENDVEYDNLYTKYMYIKLLVIDEFGLKKPSESKISFIHRLLEDRWLRDSYTILLTNYKNDRLKHDYGDTVYSRLKLFKVLEIPDSIPDYREKLKDKIK